MRRHCSSEISTPFGQDRRRSAPDRKDGCVCEKSGGKQEAQTASGLCSRLRNLPPFSRSAFPVTLADTAREVSTRHDAGPVFKALAGFPGTPHLQNFAGTAC